MKIKIQNKKIHNLKSVFLQVFKILFHYDGGTIQVQGIKIIMK